MASAYSPEQLQAFFNIIQLPSQYHVHGTTPPSLPFLTDLLTHTLSTIPYENLSLHYSPSHTNSLDPQDLFQKIVVNRNGRGGYCMENSILFNHVLRGLGFEAYTVGVKIRRRSPNGVPSGEYIGWVHIVNIVMLPDGGKWMVDVGFGGDGATKPLPLQENYSITNIGTQELRLTRDHIPSQCRRTEESKMWIYQYRNAREQPWNSFFAFYDVEFTESDFGVMNWFTGHHPTSPQLDAVLVIKFLRRPREKSDDGAVSEIYGKRMLAGAMLKENLGGKTVLLKVCKDEDERIGVLKESFGIDLTSDEIQAIRGLKSELGIELV